MRKVIVTSIISVEILCGLAHAQTLDVLHEFQDSDGNFPQCVLVQTSDGTILGTTHYAQTTSPGNPGPGSIFKIATNGIFSTLHFFDNGTNGQYPYSGLVQGNDGRFYGITHRTSPAVPSSPAPIHYSITPSGDFTRVAALNPTTNGYYVYSGLIKGADG
jgi:hypothetical protein